MRNQNSPVIPPHINLANVRRIALCLYFVMQMVINLAEVRQVAQEAQKCFVLFQDTGITSNEVLQTRNGRYMWVTHDFLKTIEYVDLRTLPRLLQIAPIKTKTFQDTQCRSILGRLAQKGITWYWRGPKYTNSPWEFWSVILRNSFGTVYVQLCVQYLSMCLCLSLYIYFSLSITTSRCAIGKEPW